MTIAHHAALLGISTETLFRKAYDECGGVRYALRPPEELHALWKRGLCCSPPYVTQFLRKEHMPVEQPLLI